MAETRQVNLEIKDNTKSLKAQLKEAQAEVQTLADKYGATSEQAVNAAKRAAELKDKIGDAKSLTDAFNPDAKFKALTSSLSGVAGGFSAVTGAMGLVGAESENLQKMMLKVQSAMALSQGLQALGESRDSFKQLGAVVTNTFSGMTTAGKAFYATGIGLLLAGVGLLIANWDKLKASMTSQTAVQRISNQVAAQSFAAIANEVSAADKLSKTLQDETITRAKKIQKIKEFQAAYPGLLKNINLETMSIEQINGQLVKNIELLKLQAEVKAIEAVRADKMQQKIKAQLDVQSAAQENASNWAIALGDDAANGWIGYRSAADNAAIAAKKFTDIQTVSTKAIDKDVKSLDQASQAIEKKIEALKKEGAQVSDGKEKTKDYSKEVAKFSTVTATNTEAIDKRNEALQNTANLERELATERIKAIEDEQKKSEEQLKLEAKNRIEDIKKTSADSKIKAALIKQIEENLAADLLKIQKEFNDKAEEKRKELLKIEQDAIFKANANKVAQENEFQLKIEEIDEANFQAKLKKQMTEGDYEKELVRQKYFNLEQQAKGNAEQEAIIAQAKRNELDAIDAKYTKKSEDRAKAEFEFKANLQTKYADIATQAAALLTATLGKSKAAQKTAVIIESAAGIAKMIISNKLANLGALATPQAIATSGAAAAPVIAANNVSLGLGIAANIAATAKALKEIGGGGTAPSAPSGGGGDSAGAGGGVMAPNFNVVGNNGINQLAQLQQQPIKAYVVGSEVTTQQALDRNRINNSTL